MKTHKPVLVFPVCIALILVSATNALAVLGLGAHKTGDFTLEMPPTTGKGEKETLEGLSLVLPDNRAFDQPIFIYVSRSNWRKTDIDFGGKLYIDIIPAIDALEFSMNVGVWEYEANLSYPHLKPDFHTISPGLEPSVYVEDTTISLRRKEPGKKQYLEPTTLPYTKVDLNLTIRKYILQLPRRTELWRTYAGGGLTLYLSTPVISSATVKKTLDKYVHSNISTFDELENDIFTQQGVLQQIVQDVTGSGLSNKTAGVHLLLGTMFQVPRVPLSVYADGKLMLPFTDLDANVGLRGIGFILAAGIALSVSQTNSGFE